MHSLRLSIRFQNYNYSALLAVSRLKRIIRVLLCLGLAAFGCFGAGLLAINLYIQSPGIQRQLRESVSESLDLPIDVFRITFTPWYGLNLESVTVGNVDLTGPVLRAQTLRVRCDYFALFRHKIIIREILLQHVAMTVPVASAASDKPEARVQKAIAGSPGASESIGRRTPRSIYDTAPVAASKSPTLRDTLTRRFWVEIQKFKLRDAAITVVHPDGSIVAQVNGLNCILNFRHGDYLGRAHAESATVGNAVQINDIGAPLKFEAGVLAVGGISASLSGGELTGDLKVDFTNPEVPYHLQMSIAGVDLNEVASHTSNFLDRAHGTLEGSFELNGNVRNVSTLSGSGSVEIKSAYLDQYPLMQEIGRWTQIDELKRLNLERAVSDFRVVGPNIQFDSISLVSKNCTITLNGKVEDAHRLDLDGRLTVSQFLSQKIPNELGDNFHPTDDGHGRYIDFQVSGSIVKPQSNLIDRIIGDRRKLWQRLLHGGRPAANHASASE
jgi:hypothetical protein